MPLVDSSEEPQDLLSSVSIDNVIFGIKDNRLKVLLVHPNLDDRPGYWALPGGHIKVDEDLRAGAGRVLQHLTGLKNVHLRQLRAFGEVARLPDKRIITIGYYALVRSTLKITANLVSDWCDIAKLPPLMLDHDRILQAGIHRLRQDARFTPIGFELLPKKFTLTQLQKIYEAIFDAPLDKGNFRRKVLKHGFLIELDEKQMNVAHRAARYYRFDPRAYRNYQKSGFAPLI
jgi:hypothetical protein